MTSKAIWCDFGGVLTPPVSETVAHFSQRVGAAPEVLIAAMTAIAKRFGTHDLMEPLDTPLISGEDWAREMEAEVARATGTAIDLSDFGSKWFDDRAPNSELVDHLRAARRRGTFVGMLSNMVPSWDEHWRKMVPASEFDDLVMSFQVGTRKPEPAIYALAAERARAFPADCILIDDLDKNCVGARASGWHAIRFLDNPQTLRELYELLNDTPTSGVNTEERNTCDRP